MCFRVCSRVSFVCGHLCSFRACAFFDACLTVRGCCCVFACLQLSFICVQSFSSLSFRVSVCCERVLRVHVLECVHVCFRVHVCVGPLVWACLFVSLCASVFHFVFDCVCSCVCQFMLCVCVCVSVLVDVCVCLCVVVGVGVCVWLSVF